MLNNGPSNILSDDLYLVLESDAIDSSGNSREAGVVAEESKVIMINALFPCKKSKLTLKQCF